MFLLKKIISIFINPLSIIVILSIIGLCLLWRGKNQRLGKIFITLGIVLLLLLSFDPLPIMLLTPLERKYDMYERDSISHTQQEPVKYIVVLGGGHVSDETIPITSQINIPTLIRLMEGIRIYRDSPGSKLILSGGQPFERVPEAEVMFEVARIAGVDSTDIILESESLDTDDEARFLRPIIGSDHFILVTSASHMPRAVKLFQYYGMNPIPAPTDHLVRRKQVIAPDAFAPKSHALLKAERAFHEYLGYLWFRITTLFQSQGAVNEYNHSEEN